MRVLITGASGFVGQHLSAFCQRQGVEVIGLSRSLCRDRRSDELDRSIVVDLTNSEEIANAVRDTRPDWIFHLAALASVAASWQDPNKTMEDNLASATNLLEAVRLGAPNARTLVACSGEAYGPVAAESLPITEAEPFRPQNPYAVSKAAVDLVAGFYADARRLEVVRTRSFNHCGPGQSIAYVVAAFARQIALAEFEGRDAVVLKTGDLSPKRDFTDVRDVVRAYWLALDRAPIGAYNVCSGISVAIGDILSALASQSSLEVVQETDPGLVREHQVMELRGSHDKLTDVTDWQPEIPLLRTLRDTLDWWRERIAAGEAG